METAIIDEADNCKDILVGRRDSTETSPVIGDRSVWILQQLMNLDRVKLMIGYRVRDDARGWKVRSNSSLRRNSATRTISQRGNLLVNPVRRGFTWFESTTTRGYRSWWRF